ncbi:MAG TPA: vWA domain-containing protein [Rudaea sp.]|nr:vWA domain-containing protein [Rudaea sp.]
MLTHLHWTYAWALWALPLALLPLFNYGARTFAYPALVEWPPDLPSRVAQILLRLTGALTLAALVVASAAPYLEGGTQTLSGTGAEIVIVLDRSGSMSEPLIGTGDAGSIRGETHVESKIEAARRILLAFMRRRPGDTFGMVTFNASPIGVAPLGEDRGLVESALISAEARSEGYTAPARALGLALDYFRDRQLTASRVVLLVSDGGATISSENRAKLTDLFAARHASLIWIYTRGEQEPSVRVPQQFASESLSMHEFFESLGSPYQMFEVTSAEGLERAVAEVGRLTNLPTRYEEHLPRKDLAAPLFGLALLCIVALIGARLLEVQTWQA